MTNKKSTQEIPYSAELVNFLIQSGRKFDYICEPCKHRITIRCTTKQLWKLAVEFKRSIK